MKLYLLLVLLIASSQCLRQNCHNPPSDYVLHMRDSGNFGTETVQGYMTDEAFEFGGEGQYRDFGPTTLGGNVSISFWAKWEGYNSWSRIMDFSNGPGSDNILIANEGKSNNLAYQTWNGAASQYKRRNGWIKPGVWNHYTMIITENGEQQVFVNGKQSGVHVTGSQNPINNLERKFSYIGRSAWGHDGYFKGTIDEFVIYNRVLEKEEIRCLADLCDDTCSSSCEEKANECHSLFEGDNEDDSCPLPVDPILDQSEANQNGEFAADQPGPVSNNAAVFTGENYLDFGPQTIGGNLSFCLWAKFDAKGSWQRFFDFGKAAHNNNILVGEQGITNTIDFHIYETGGPADIYRLDQGFDIGTWHHWCFTTDLSGNQGLYRDGRVYGTQNARAHGRGAPIILRENTFVGKSNWADAMFKGSIDGFQVFDRVLKPQEIECMGAVCPDECLNGAEQCALNGPFCKQKKCVTIFSECDFQGQSQQICDEEPELDSQDVKSISVPEGVKFSLYNGHNFENQVAYFTQSVSCLDSINWEDQEELEADGIQLVKTQSNSENQQEEEQSSKKSHLKGNMKTKKQFEEEQQNQTEQQE